MFRFQQHGESGAWVSDLLPNISRIVDDVAFVKSVNTEAINHDPATTFIQTGSQQPGRPSLGAWLSYGLGSDNQNLPAFVVLISQGSGNKTDQPIFSRLWGSGFLPTRHQGVRFRSGDDPVLYLSNPPGIDRETRRRMLDGVGRLNAMAADAFGDPEINTRIAQYEMAYRMQTSVPESDRSLQRAKILRDLYGIDDTGVDGGLRGIACWRGAWSSAECGLSSSCIAGGTSTPTCPTRFEGKAATSISPSAALILDLKQRGLLDDTLVIWGGEFGRTVYSQGALTRDNYGRDHHGRCFTMWLAGGGVKPGITYGETDDYCYNVVRDPVHIHDLNATVLRCLGIDHTRLTFRFQGRDFRLTDVAGKVVEGLLA